MKKTTVYFNLFFSLLILFCGCERQNDLTELPKSNMRTIGLFVINATQNYGKIPANITSSINQSTKVITLSKFPLNASLTALRPQIVISPLATVYPNNLDSVDFSNDTTEFTVTAQSGKKTVYAVVKTK
jgi:hypothetical protein